MKNAFETEDLSLAFYIPLGPLRNFEGKGPQGKAKISVTTSELGKISCET